MVLWELTEKLLLEMDFHHLRRSMLPDRGGDVELPVVNDPGPENVAVS